jgi:hypothetical protein
LDRVEHPGTDGDANGCAARELIGQIGYRDAPVRLSVADRQYAAHKADRAPPGKCEAIGPAYREQVIARLRIELDEVSGGVVLEAFVESIQNSGQRGGGGARIREDRPILIAGHSSGDAKVRVPLVAPARLLNVAPPSVLTCHCTDGVGLPVALAENDTLVPAIAETATGFDVITGRVFTVRVAA